MALTSECEVHGWSWDPADDMACPVCHGIAEERERVISILKEELEVNRSKGLAYSVTYIKQVIALIKGENK